LLYSVFQDVYVMSDDTIIFAIRCEKNNKLVVLLLSFFQYLFIILEFTLCKVGDLNYVLRKS